MATAFLLVFLGALSRIIPHAPDFLPFGALGLYSGARWGGARGIWVPIGALLLSDLFLEWNGQHLAVHLTVYLAFAAIALGGRLAKEKERRRVAFLAGLSVSASVLFFLTTNFALWAAETFYPHTAAGLAACYLAGLPLLVNTAVADLLGTAVLFGLDGLVRRRRLAVGRTAAILCVGLGLLLSHSAAAQQPPSVSESVVVSATASPEQQTELGAATTVITRTEIEQRGFTTVLEVLRSVPGLDVSRSGGDGSITSVFLRGANSTGTLVLVDGVRVDSPFFGGYDFSTLTTESIDRIEIVRGPFSALYGSDPLGGVIQIFTRRAGTGLSGQAAFEAGDSGQRNGAIGASYGAGATGIGVSFRDAQVTGDRPNSDWTEKNGSLRFDQQFSDAVHLALIGGINDSDVGVPGPVGGETPHARSTFREERFSLPVTVRASDSQQLSFQLATVSTRSTYDDPDSPFFGLTETRSDQARIADTWTSGRSRLTGFASWERQRVDDSSNFGVNLDGQHTTIWGTGFEEDLALSGGFSATAGLRYDDHSQFGSAWSPRGTIAWLSADSLWKLRASAGTAFRAPTVGELYYPFVGNPDLKPEHSQSYEVGAERYVSGGRAQVSLFWNEFRDLIVYDFSQFQDFNIGRARTRGVEVGWQQTLSSALSVDLGYTYLDAQNLTTGGDLIRRPQNSAFLSLSVQPVSRLTVSPRVVLVGRRADQDALTGAAVEDPSYVRWDIYARYQLGHLVPYARVENLTDRQYEEVDGYPAPRRRYAVGLEARF